MVTRTLRERVRAAIGAFRNPSEYRDAGPNARIGVNLPDDQIERVVEDMFANVFRDSVAPDDAEEAVGAIDPEIAGDVADRVVAELPHVPDGALVRRLTFDGPSKVRVFYYTPDETDPNRATESGVEE